MIKSTKNSDPNAIQNSEEIKRPNPDPHPDPITGTPGSHPVGTGIGAATAGAAGLAIGSIVPGVGSAIGGAIGAAIGAVAGGLAGKGLAEAIDPTTENNYWRSEHRNRTYYDSSLDYDTDFGPAYRFGWESYVVYGDRPIESNEAELRAAWEQRRGTSRLQWDRAQHAVRDAWDRVRSRSNAVTRKDLEAPAYGGSARDDATHRGQAAKPGEPSSNPDPISPPSPSPRDEAHRQ